ncbi:MAG TPA: hypothetical protein VIY27_00565 [Myxococcota bacterium]
MRSKAAWIACAVGVALATGAAAQAERRAASDFHRRALVEGPLAAGEAHAVPLSREAVAAFEEGGELRVFDAAGREIPSLVHSAASQRDVVDRPVSIFNRVWSEDRVQMLSVEVEGRVPEAVNEFVFDIADEEYSARVRVEASQEGSHWQIVGEDLHLIRHTVKEQKIAYLHNVLRIPTARFRFYRFTLRPTLPEEREVEASEAPLEIEGVAVREVVNRGSALSLPARLERYDDPQDADTRHHHWKLDLGTENLGVDRVAFTIPAVDFARSASLWEWSPERQRRTRRLATTVAFHYGDDVHTEFTGFTTNARVLVLTIDQGDDEPVAVTAAVASRPRQQVRFFGPADAVEPVALYFDPDAPRTPRYDLERRLREHEITSFAELALGPLEDNPAYAAPAEPRSERIPYLLYALVIPLVAALTWYVIRTIQRGAPPEDPPGA